MEDLAIVGTTASSFDGLSGVGLVVFDGADSQVTRGTLRGNTAVGVAVGGGALFEAHDLLIADTQPELVEGSAGRGLEVGTASVAKLTRALVLGNHDMGLLIDGAQTHADLEDIVIVGTQPAPESGLFGRGLGVQDGATAQLRRARVLDNHQVGIAIATEADVVLDQVEVGGTPLAPCWPACAREAGGTGLAIWAGATAQVTCLASHDNALAGVQVALGATCTMDGARLVGNRFAYDLRGAPEVDLDGVCAVGNAQDRSTSGVTTPETAPLLDFTAW